MPALPLSRQCEVHGDRPRRPQCFRCERSAQSRCVAEPFARSQLPATPHVGQPSLARADRTRTTRDR